MSEPFLDPELSELEQSLARLEPQEQLSRDVVFFKAGQASVRRPWFWPACSGLSTLVAASLGWLLLQRPTPEPERIIETVVVEKLVPQPIAVTPTPAPESREVVDHRAVDYLKRRNEVLRFGADVLPESLPQVTSDDPLTPASTPRFDGEAIDIRKFLRLSSFFSGEAL